MLGSFFLSCTLYNYCTLYNRQMSSPERPSHRTAGQRAGLSREAVLGAARRVADDQGVDHLTMRRLAAELGVTPNALYTYFPDKEALLDALVDDLLAGIEPGDPDEGDWRDGLVRVMDGSRRVLPAPPRGGGGRGGLPRPPAGPVPPAALAARPPGGAPPRPPLPHRPALAARGH